MARKSFDIVGGGFSGMALAWYLSGQGAKVALYEASEKLGGLLDSLSTGYGLIEQAANGLLASQDVEELLADLRLRPLPSKRLHPARYIFRGQPQRLPLQGLEWWALLRLFKAKLGRFQSLTPEQGESLYAWSLRHWGESLTAYVVEPAFQGIFASPLEGLSASLCLQSLYQPLRRGRLRGTVGVKGGMRSLVDTWTVALLRRGVEVHLNTRWRPVPGAGPAVLCVAPRACADILEEEPEHFRQKLRNLPRVGLTTVTAFFEPSPGDLRGFGILLPRKEKFHALGVLFNSDIFWERGEPLRSETYIFPEGLGSLEELLEDRERFQKSAASPLHVEVTSRPKALPLYGLQLEGFLRSNSLQRGRFRLFGNSFGNLGLSRILHQSKALAVELMKEAG